MAISSPAFELNGAIPPSTRAAARASVRRWNGRTSLQSRRACAVRDRRELPGSASGIRWIVGGIESYSKGVAAGSAPAGGIVGTDTAGKAAYSPICPAPGKSDTVEFVLYALSKKISLSPGFQPDIAESQYGSQKLLLGEAAVTYGVASR